MSQTCQQAFRQTAVRLTTRRFDLRRSFLDWRAFTYAAEIEIGIRTSPGAAQYLLRSFICIRSETIPWFLNIDMVTRAWKAVIVLTSSTMKAVCTENLDSEVLVMKSTKDRV
jgi:hypothetical protein